MKSAKIFTPRDLYYNYGLRKFLGLIKQSSHMGFLNEPVKVLDDIMERHVFLSPAKPIRLERDTDLTDFKELNKDSSLSFKNRLLLSDRQYMLSKDTWQNIHYSLLEGDGDSSCSYMERQKSFDLLNSLMQGIIADLLPKEEEDPITNTDSKIDKQASKLLRTTVKALYSDKLFKYNVPPVLGNEHALIKTLSRKFIFVLQQCYLESHQRFNDDENKDSIRLPFTSLAMSLGSCVVNQIFALSKVSLRELLDVKKNSSLKEWIKDPHLTKRQKLLNVTADFLESHGFDKKDIKLIITSVCVQYYQRFFKKASAIKDDPDMYELLRFHMGPHMEQLIAYVEGRTLKIGAALIGMLLNKGVFEEVRLIPIASLRQTNNAQRKIAPYHKMRVIHVAQPVVKAFVSPTRIDRPYLIPDNCNKPITGQHFVVTDQIRAMHKLYKSDMDYKVHKSSNSRIIIHDPDIAYHKTEFMIDQDALRTLLLVISKGLPALTGIAWTEKVYGYVAGFLSLFNISITELETLELSLGSQKSLLKDFYVFLQNLNSTHKDSEEFIKMVQSVKLSQTNEQYLIQLVRKATGAKRALLGLISDAIIYSHFDHFTITSFLDTRARRYYHNTNLNIQAYVITKTIVKMNSKPLSRDGPTLEKEFNAISNILHKMVHSSPIKEQILNDKIREDWLTKNHYNKPISGTELLDRQFHLRYEQLLNYFAKTLQHDNIQIINTKEIFDILINNPQGYHTIFPDHELFSHVLALFSKTIKKTKKMLLALNLLRSILFEGRFQKDFPIKTFRMKPYPYEVDATASGIQMTAMLLKDSQLAAWSNLKHNPAGHDLYTEAGNRFKSDVLNIIRHRLHYNSTNPMPLVWYIPREYFWFIKRVASKLPFRKKDTCDYVASFMNHQLELTSMPNYPQLLEACTNRDLWKKCIMTYGYGSTSQSRIDSHMIHLQENSGLIIDKTTAQFMSQMMEDHFINVIQPELIPGTRKLKLIARRLTTLQGSKINETEDLTNPQKPVINELDVGLNNENENNENDNEIDNEIDNKNKNKNIKSAEILSYTCKFFTHETRPTLVKSEKIQTNSLKGRYRGHHVNITLNIYNAKGELILNPYKADQAGAPNLTHCTDARIVHELTSFIKRVNKQIREEKSTVKPIEFTTTHDCFTFTDSYFAKSMLELQYMIVHKEGLANALKNNKNYPLIKEILGRKYVFEDETTQEDYEKTKEDIKAKKKDPLKFKRIKKKFPRILHLNKVHPSFVK
ncbi:MAG: DNA-directed RNA polymerase [Psychrobacillus psychrotolerans]|uniref:DNA-directed RNA polymerase n=1 Tax=Psychrobacillus psychrotolerans TaxID=126156 RepID=UPI003BB1F17A